MQYIEYQYIKLSRQGEKWGEFLYKIKLMKGVMNCTSILQGTRQENFVSFKIKS